MQIPINQFEQYIDETILKRGLSYFKNGHVFEPEVTGPGRYEAIVKGAGNYTVQLSIKNDVITDYVCDCPYDLGPVCKHVAAVIFYLQQDTLKLKVKTKNETSVLPPKTPKRKTKSEKVDELLEKVTHDELKQFVREIASHNTAFRNLVLSSFVQHNTNESKALYAKQIKSILRSATGRNGFIDWSASRHVGIAVGNLLESARKQMDNHNYRSAVFISTAVMEQMAEALQYSDDSNGDIGGCVYEAFEMLSQMANEPLDEPVRKLIIEYCLTAFDSKIYKGWDWHIGMLSIASSLLKTEEETVRILGQIDQAQKSEYEREQAQLIKFEILLKIKGEKEAWKYLEQNITNSDLRREAIRKALANKNFEKAVTIARDGINYNKDDSPGLAMEWYDWLLKIAQAQGDTENIINYARYLFIDNFRNEQDYYQILKDHVNPESWNSFIEALIRDILTKKRWPDTGLIANIYIKEAWWNRLMELVRKTPNLNTIEHYEKYLARSYSDEIIELYSGAIIEFLKYNVGRGYYKTSCRYLRRMIKLGGREKTNGLIFYLRAEYPQRKALMEELNHV